MVLVISQETFDQAVQENINDLGMSPEEALTEAIGQFKAQGVDLSQVVTDLSVKSAFENISNIIRQLKEFQNKIIAPECSELLLNLKQECDKGIQHRVYAGRAGAYDVIIDIFLKSEATKEVKLTTLKTMISLMTKQPDLLNERGMQIIIANLDKSTDPEIQKFTLKWCKECCVMQEMNRQMLIEMNIVDPLSQLLNEGSPRILKEILILLRALVLDDDIRVEFGRAHEHARIIALATLTQLVELMKRFKTDEVIINDLILTLSSLLVRTEFCLKVKDVDGIETIHEIINLFIQNDKIIRQCFKLIKALAGNDECKALIIQKGLAPVICNSLNVHQGVVPTSTAGLNCIAALTLRCPENSKALFEASVPEVIIEIMRKHPEEKMIQKTACWAIRNMVSRSRYQNKHFLELGTEEILHKNLAKYKDFEYDIKAALRDLECNVELKEEWTGKGGKITSETALKME